MSNNKSIIDNNSPIDSEFMEKNINFTCTCGYLIVKPIRLKMVLPCEHIFHEVCIKGKKKCPICNEKIKGEFNMTKKVKNNIDAQRYIDMLSVTNQSDLYKYNPSYMLDNTYDMIGLIIKILNHTKRDNIQDVINDILSLNHVNVHIRGLDRIDKTKNRVYIANHSSFFDQLVIMKYIDTYFLASSIVKKYSVINNLLDSVPMLIIERGKGKRDEIIKKMKEHIKKHSSICIYPEGCVTNMNTLIKFRGGAFSLEEPIYPIILRYENTKSDANLKDIILNLSSRDKIDIYMDVIGPYYPPFTKENIEQIRRDMANVGGLLLARTSNRDIIEKKYD